MFDEHHNGGGGVLPVPQLFFYFTLDWCLEHLPQHHASSPGISPLSGTPFSSPQGKFGLDWIRQGKVGHWLWSVYCNVIVKVKPDAAIFPPATSASQTFSLFLLFPFTSSSIHYCVKCFLHNVFYSHAHTLAHIVCVTYVLPKGNFICLISFIGHLMHPLLLFRFPLVLYL